MSICVCCQREDAWAEIGAVCIRCRDRMAAALRNIPHLLAELQGLGYVERDLRPGTRAVRLDGILTRVQAAADPVANVLTAGPLNGSKGAPRVSGSPTASVPISLDAVDLSGPVNHEARRLLARGLLGLDEDQTGHLSAATILDGWVRDWASYRTEGPPHPQVPLLCSWLLDRLDWACGTHPAVDEFAGEVRELHSTLTAACGRFEAAPETLTAPCPDCGLLALYRDVDAERIACGAGCARLMTEEDYAEYVRMLIEEAA